MLCAANPYRRLYTSSITPLILEPIHTPRLSIRLLHTLYQRLEPHGDAQSADFDAPRQPLLERITSPDSRSPRAFNAALVRHHGLEWRMNWSRQNSRC